MTEHDKVRFVKFKKKKKSRTGPLKLDQARFTSGLNLHVNHHHCGERGLRRERVLREYFYNALSSAASLSGADYAFNL